MRSLVVAGLLVSASVAHAQPGGAPQPSPPPVPVYQIPGPLPAPPPAERTFSLTISPLHLLFPIVEVTGELAVSPQLGVAGIVGVGQIAVTAGSSSSRFFVAEGGASVRYYVTGSFRKGVQLGGELLYAHVEADSSDGTVDASAFAAGVSIGPFVGYKWSGASGFTFDGQLGVAYSSARAEASDGGSTATAEQSAIYPLLNLNIGWSF